MVRSQAIQKIYDRTFFAEIDCGVITGKDGDLAKPQSLQSLFDNLERMWKLETDPEHVGPSTTCLSAAAACLSAAVPCLSAVQQPAAFYY